MKYTAPEMDVVLVSAEDILMSTDTDTFDPNNPDLGEEGRE